MMDISLLGDASALVMRSESEAADATDDGLVVEGVQLTLARAHGATADG